MSPILFHIYGPISIHSFGAMIVFGAVITLYLLHRDQPLHTFISDDQLATIVQISFFSGMIGGRCWFLITNQSMILSWTDVIAVWSGGLSILGAIIATIIALSVYFYNQNLPALPILDRLALYAPLLQSISRFGCFFAGCCYGQTTNLPWSIIYKHPDSLAPLHIALHPTQIYSSLFLLSSFIILLCFDRYYRNQKPGQIIALYLILISLERFFVDFFRGDQEFLTSCNLCTNLSIQQILALCLCITGLIIMIFVTLYKNKAKVYNSNK
ncbi:prolipoprotein diacylglyceryl transferase [Candidatus Babeliales bacterium]|nr:prolipoprotein diacylglyceryl transferase [Candidatus Babeliales bacterium]MBP9843362.1 prolipoprotein diacylglyceryl transferase [Candidatus Babeliales bacterium]